MQLQAWKLDAEACDLPAKIGIDVTQPWTSKTARRLDAVALLDLSRQYAAIREEILAAVERVCASGQFILGEEAAALEHEFSVYTGAAGSVGCASGTEALWLALAAAGVRPGSSVITTAFSFFASASAIVRAGARPLFVDVDPRTLNLDPAQVEAQLRAGKPNNLRALLPVHLYGQCADMDALNRLSDAFHVPLIEDAAQAVGAAWRGRRAGSLGLAAAFSFYPTKNLSAMGDAGLVTTNSPELAERMRSLRNHGSRRRYLHQDMGWNSRLDAIQAAILRVKLPHLEDWNRCRRERAANYDRLFTQAGLLSPGDDAPVRILSVAPHAHHVFHQYVIRARRRDALRGFLNERKIGAEIYYPIPLHLQPVFAWLGYREGDLPESERAAREVLALPIFPELTDEEQQWVVESVAEFYS
ncbi:MAG TPA: DegT/DnrJ/EryC1/StrS family aminotransferase [Candidatus Acidoferrales bacterium]|nr:DegT/DnrJ/EryC1/StrS family aminotransferase [Candidatus Acidoferrales bacterium]HXY51345.1 DegT/DnrJ/EryC1/StrS family aminotransferase [Terriglobales bacterium]